MAFEITIEFDVTEEDLELMKVIGERAKQNAERIVLGGGVFEPLPHDNARAVKDLLREALKVSEMEAQFFELLNAKYAKVELSGLDSSVSIRAKMGEVQFEQEDDGEVDDE